MQTLRQVYEAAGLTLKEAVPLPRFVGDALPGRQGSDSVPG